MMKGISQSKRNNAWHIKHTKNKANDRIRRIYRLAQYRIKGPSYDKAESLYRKALEREKGIKLNFWQRIVIYFRRLLKQSINA